MSMLPTGDRIGNDWQGPNWTPFAQAIADNYGVQVPLFLNIKVDLGPSPSRYTTVTRPLQYDALIFGAHVQGTASQLPFVFLQVTHQESGVSWSAPGVMPGVPLTAFAGVNVNNMPNLRLPESFFLDANSTLKLDFVTLGQPTFVDADPLVLTLIGTQLINPRGTTPLECITMPDGAKIRTDSRLPLFLTVPLGHPIGAGNFALFNNEQSHHFLPPIGCDFELHDLCTNMISGAISIAPGSSSLIVKLATLGVEKQWTPNFSPITAAFGGPGGGGGGSTQVFPAMPYTKPYLLRKDRRLEIAVQNTSDTQLYTQPVVSFRGVRLCEY